MGSKKKKSKSKKAIRNESKYKCELCEDRDKSKPIVACDVCDKWHHFSCVNLVSISKKDTWICEKCTNQAKAKEPKARKATDPSPMYSCVLCQNADNDEMIFCDSCKRTYHHVCVKVDLTRLPEIFICKGCNPEHSERLSTAPGTGTLNRARSTSRLMDSPMTSPTTIQRSKHNESSDAIARLHLEFLEEQRAFHERWDRKKELREQDYLQEKYKVLKEKVDLQSAEYRTQRESYTESWVSSVHQSELDRELLRVRQPSDSLEIDNFSERLNQLKFCRNTSSVKEPVSPAAQHYPINEPLKFPECTRSKVFANAPTSTANLQDRMRFPPQDENFNFPIRHNSLGFDEFPKPTKIPVRDETFEFTKPLDSPKSPVKNVQQDPSNQSSFSQKVNVKTPLPNADSQLKSYDPSVKTLTKAQIAARQVVKYSLHHFYGDPLEWISWYSSYESTTEMCGYTDAENLHRLKESLKGNAEAAVKHRFLSPAQVPSIIKTLRMLFGRPDLIVNALLQKVKDVPAPKADRLETLVDYAMEVNSISATIEAAKIQYHLSNPNLIHELVEKLPVHTKVDWAKFKASQTEISLKVLADWLYNLAEIVCTVTVPSSSKAPNKSEKKSKGTERLNVLQIDDKEKSSTNSNKENSNHQCKVCNGKCVNISKCSTFQSYDIKQKWNIVNKNKLCRKCLKKHNGYCKKSKDCGVNGCVFKHHSLLHTDRQAQRIDQQPPSSLNTVSAVVTNNFHNTSSGTVLFRIVPVTLYNEDVTIQTYAYIDEGSSGTLLEEDLAADLQLVGKPERLCLLWTNNVHRIEEKSHRMNVIISGQLEFSIRYLMKGVRTVKNLGLPSQSINRQDLIKRFSHLADIPLISYVNETPRLLIGLPHVRLCTQLKLIEGSEHQPIASMSRIGWSLHGPTTDLVDSYVQQINQHRVNICPKSANQSDDELHRLVKDHFSLENFGVNINTEFNPNSQENKRALDILKNGVERVNGRYRSKLLWRYDEFELEDTFNMAKRRLVCLERSKKNHIPAINAIINDYIAKGYLTKLSQEELAVKRSKVGYLPIFVVTSPKKPNKIRMVFDAAAKSNGQSLNDMLLTGPDQLNSLVDILRRYREHTIAIGADINEMYHQIEVCDEDKHVQRILWRNGDTNKEPDIYVLNVMTFGAKCSPSVAQYVKSKNAEEFRNEHPEAVEAIVTNTYVDDMMDGGKTEDEVIQLVNNVQKIHNHGGFKIGKFLSNSTKVLEALGESKATTTKQLDVDPMQKLERVLGMFWNTTTDCFMFSLKFAKINEEVTRGERYPTKREILQTLMSIFDPLGLIQHFLVRLKILLQNIWRSELKWDDQLTANEHKAAWESWFKLLPKVETLQIPRLYSPNLSNCTVDLHIFVDASENAYATVAFLRIESQHHVKCVLVGSKTRVAPIKYVSIPRLELQAGVLGTRFMNSIEKSQKIKMNRRIIWTDSSTVVSWLRSDHKKYQQFVAHRIGEILENSDLDMWRWLPGSDNVADDATKWERIPTFDQNCRWYSGPDFLYQPEENWPREQKRIECDTIEEMKIHHLYVRLFPPPLVDPERFSNWNRMVRALAYVIHYTRILRAKIYKENAPGRTLSQDELFRARNIILTQAQYEGYRDEMVILTRNQNVSKHAKRKIPQSSSIISCSPYLDENGLLRVRGRIDAVTNIPIEQKRPIILPKRNRITSLLVSCYHRIYNAMTRKFWFVPRTNWPSWMSSHHRIVSVFNKEAPKRGGVLRVAAQQLRNLSIRSSVINRMVWTDCNVNLFPGKGDHFKKTFFVMRMAEVFSF